MIQRVFACVLILAILPFVTLGQDKSVRQAGEKMSILLSYIDMLYVDPADIDKLSDAAIRAVLMELDPHSYYLSVEELDEANEELTGRFEGIGVQFQIHKDTIVVISPITGGPSERVGILAGDKIILINGENATGPGIDNRFVFDRLRGPAGTKVGVGIQRGRREEVLEYTITRDRIPVTTLDAAFMANKEIGYIRINRFAQNTMPEFQQAMKTLKKEGMKKLILDLRNNSGGYLHSAVDLVDQFLDNGRLIVYTAGHHSPRQDFISTWLGSFTKGEVVVLIDEGSASASEIVAGAVQDWDRGIVIGRRSFGKGLVQKQFPLNDGSAVRLTTARYYTPSGRSIQKPYVDGLEKYFMELNERFEHGEFVYADSIRFPDSLRYTTKGGRTVYGGGGIMPDVFVPWDSTSYTDLFADLIRTGAINDFVLEFLEDQRADLKTSYPNVYRFKAGFILSSDMESSFRNMAIKRVASWDDEAYEASRSLVVSQIKALIARNIFDVSAYFQIMMAEDDAFKHAVEALDNQELWRRILPKAK